MDWLANAKPEATCLINEHGRHYSYEDVKYLSQAIATLYSEDQVKSRSLILILAENTVESICAYIGFMRLGCAVMLLPGNTSDNQLQDVVTLFEPSLIFSHTEISSISIPLNKIRLTERIANRATYLFKTPWSNLDLHPDLALLLSTSGSTGEPNFVRISYQNLIANTQAICDGLNISDADRAITTLPPSYTYGLSIINTHLYSGASIVLNPHAMMRNDFWKLIRTQRVNNFGGVPFNYEMLKKIKFSSIDVPSLKYITQAGGKLDTNTAQYFAKTCKVKELKFFIMYGQTEATARMSILSANDHENKLKSIGKPINSGSFRIIDEDGHVKAAYEEGELIFQGANVSLGYAKNKNDLMLGDRNQGILKTGDIAYCDNDGYYYIVGRKKRFIKLYGHRVNLEFVEQQLSQSGFDCACAGQDDELIIYVHADVEKHTIFNQTKQLLNINPRCINVIHVNAIPRNAAGKVLYPKLQEFVSA